MERDEGARRAVEHVSAAMPDLAHSTSAVEDPKNLSPILTDLLASVRSLVHVTDQLAHAHLRLRQHARSEDGDATLGGRMSDSAAWALMRARELLDAAEAQVDEASEQCAKVAWCPAERPERWVNVVFLENADAAEALELIDRLGVAFAIRHLSRLDRGDEATEDALVNGYVYDTIPTCLTDCVAQDAQSGYAITFNPTLGYVSLHRRYETEAASHPAERAQDARGTSAAAPLVPASFCSPAKHYRNEARSVAL